MYFPVLQQMLNIILTEFYKIFVKDPDLIYLTRLQIVTKISRTGELNVVIDWPACLACVSQSHLLFRPRILTRR